MNMKKLTRTGILTMEFCIIQDLIILLEQSQIKYYLKVNFSTHYYAAA